MTNFETPGSSYKERLIHGTTVFLNGKTFLIQGPSGVGKSDLALRLLYEHSAQLISDDYTCLEKMPEDSGQNSAPYWRASSPPETRGLLEVRELGILKLPKDKRRESGFLDYVISLTQDKVERLPKLQMCPDFSIPIYVFSAKTASLVSKILILSQLGTLEPQQPAKTSLPTTGK